jgi:RNA polymerase-binding transcription factor DksA
MTYEHHKEALLTTLKEVTVELASLGIHNPDVNEDWVATPLPGSDETDPNDVADNAEEWEERAATLALLETTWNDTRRALAKMDAGTYGTCEICQAPITEDRLEANPSARTCLAHIDEEATLSL